MLFHSSWLMRAIYMCLFCKGTQLSSQRTEFLQVARMSGTGAQLYTALSNKHPSEGQMLKGFRLFYDHIPFIHTSHIFANDTFLDVFEGASRVHIVDYGILYGLQWPCLISRLARRPGGPPHLRITGMVTATHIKFLWCSSLKVQDAHFGP